MALQLPGIQYLQGYAQNPDIVGKFKQGYDFGGGIADERGAQDALGSYVESLFRGAPAQQQPGPAPVDLINGSVQAAGNTAPWMDAPLGDYIANLRAAESGGNDAAKNPKSSATGRYQITDATWQGLMQSHPELGLTPDGRLDPAQQDKAVRVLTSENARALKSKSLPVNPGTLYASHFLGAPQATEILGYADNTPLVSALPPEVIQANPNLQNMTVGDFKQWTAKQGGNGSGGYQAPMDLGMSQGPQAGNSGAGNGLPPREVLAKLFANPTTRGFAAELVKAAQTGDPAQKPTDDMREYAFAAAQGYQGSFADWQKSKSAGTNVTVNSGSDDFYTAADKKRGEDFVATEVAGTKAASNLAQLNRLEQLLESAPQGMEGGWKGFVGQFGINSEGLDDIQAAQALINSMVPDQRAPGSGTMSDADLALFKASIPSIINQPGGNALITQTLRGIALYDQQMGQIATQVLDRSLTPAQGRAEMAKIVNPLDAFKTASQRTAADVPEDVDPEDWAIMTPDQRALWQN